MGMGGCTGERAGEAAGRGPGGPPHSGAVELGLEKFSVHGRGFWDNRSGMNPV
jgi:hypothetical protein